MQAWVTDLGTRLFPETVAKCHQLASGVLRAAVLDRLIGFNPCDGVRLPAIRKRDSDDQVVTPEQVVQLLPAIPLRCRALVGLAAGAVTAAGGTVADLPKSRVAPT